MFRRLRDLRVDHEWSQREVAEMLSMSQTGYAQYELGKNNVPPHVLIKLAQIYSTSVDYLLEVTDVTSPYPRRKPHAPSALK